MLPSPQQNSSGRLLLLPVRRCIPYGFDIIVCSAPINSTVDITGSYAWSLMRIGSSTLQMTFGHRQVGVQGLYRGALCIICGMFYGTIHLFVYVCLYLLGEVNQVRYNPMVGGGSFTTVHWPIAPNKTVDATLGAHTVAEWLC